MSTPSSRSTSLSRAAALALAASVMLIPANVLPVLSTHTQGAARTDTIISGILALWHDGMYVISAIVFAASILIPLLKLAGLTVLICLSR